jgi:hypothetical protein
MTVLAPICGKNSRVPGPRLQMSLINTRDVCLGAKVDPLDRRQSADRSQVWTCAYARIIRGA